MAKRLAPFRIPKGVPGPIRRQLHLGRPGRFLSTLRALQLHELLVWERTQVQKTRQRLFKGFERSRRAETRQRYSTALAATQRTAKAIQHQLHQLGETFGVEPMPPVAGRGVVPTIRRAEAPSVDYALEEEGAGEVEVGIDYLRADGWAHKNTSDVSFNARLFRRDRRPLTESDVREAITSFAESGRMPRGIEVRTVSWENARGQVTTGGNADDLDNFRAILQRVGNAGLRIGLVKPERL